ncbi:MAG: hypothetical protein A2Y24_04445 [Clostridiales bacterium GWE2_32_10]|nr:MAG: hypothetical protein A2Y24_04445 [Clostridiales bacterium GWE2_32_10]
MQEKVIILLSGGQDSTTCLLQAIKEYSKENVEAISFIFNSEISKAVSCAKEICDTLKIKHSVFDAGVMWNVAGDKIVEGRNIIFLTLAGMYAESKNIKIIITGLQGDNSHPESSHPDCTEEFVINMNKTLNIAIGYDFKIKTPLMGLRKSEIWKISDDLGCMKFIADKTFSCYKGKDEHCMECSSCKERFEGYDEYIETKIDDGGLLV